MKKLFAILLTAIVFLIHFSLTIEATVGPFAEERRVIVDGEAFVVWGVFEDMTQSLFRLEDMAYILNGTPAQFNIRQIDDDRFSYWIVRGEPYTPTGNEFRPISSQVRWSIPWFVGEHFGSVTVGVDGTDEPETAIRIFSRGDEDGHYFPIERLGTLLGFSVDWWHILGINDYYVENANYVISTGTATPATLPIKSIEFLELMLNLSGHWVDNVHFISPVIDESVVWPVELHFSPGGGISNYDAPWTTVAPIRQNTEGPRLWYPLSMRHLEEGIVELTVTGPATIPWFMHSEYTPAPYLPQRIIVDTSAENIDELIYYIGDEAFHMLRVSQLPDEKLQNSRRYHVELTEDGSIRLQYVLGNMYWTHGFSIYRSQVQGDPGKGVFSQEMRASSVGDRSLFEFIDTSVDYGNVYYYSLWIRNREIQFADEQWQIRVSTQGNTYIYGEETTAEIEPLEVQGSEEVYPPTSALSSNRLLWVALSALLVAIAVVICAIRMKAIKRGAKREETNVKPKIPH